MSDQIIENKNTQEDEEISLLDLLAVLIKHRKLVIWGTIITTFLVALYLFVYPVVNKKAKAEKLTITYNLTVKDVPVNLKEMLHPSGDKKYDFRNIVADKLNSFNEVARLNKQYELFGKADNVGEYEYNSMIKRVFAEKKIVVDKGTTSNVVTVEINTKVQDITVVNNFVNDLVKSANASLYSTYIPAVEQIIAARKDVELPEDNSDLVLLNETVSFKNSFTNFIDIVSEPFISVEPKGRFKTLVITGFAALFIFIFIAFLANAVENIKKDPQASSLIKEAWNAGK